MGENIIKSALLTKDGKRLTITIGINGDDKWDEIVELNPTAISALMGLEGNITSYREDD